jgi:hypothetical protein
MPQLPRRVRYFKKGIRQGPEFARLLMDRLGV